MLVAAMKDGVSGFWMSAATADAVCATERKQKAEVVSLRGDLARAYEKIEGFMEEVDDPDDGLEGRVKELTVECELLSLRLDHAAEVSDLKDQVILLHEEIAEGLKDE